MTESLSQTLVTFLNETLGLSSRLVVFLISLLPILELRGGMIAAALLDVPWQEGMAVSIVGNMIPIPFILLFIRQILTLLQKWRPTRRIARFFENKAHKKGAELMAKHAKRIQVGLFLFVAIPLPGTGAWTGSLIASFLGIDVKKASIPICLGVLGASLIMLIITYIIPYFVGSVL